LHTFYGPCFEEDKNYGLYAGKEKELSMFIYYFKDAYRNIKLLYLKPEIDPKNNKLINLKILGMAKANIPPSIHSPSFMMYLEND
jgi:hypothetical protein